MKTYINLTNLRSTVCALILVSQFIASTAFGQTNQPSASVRSVDRPALNLITSTRNYFYDIDFPGGNTAEFFKFWRKSGFTNDSVILVGNLNGVHINAFKIKDARLGEIAKAIESISEGSLSVDIVEKDFSHGNIWTVKMADATSSKQIKTRACALPAIFSGPKPSDRIHNIVDQVSRTLLESVLEITHNVGKQPYGRIEILDSEKIVVVVGSETYVEAITSVLEAAEKVAEAEKIEKSKTK